MKNKNNLKNVGVLLIAALMVLSTTIATGNIVPTGVKGTCGSSRGGNTLITETYNHRVIEVDDNGTIVWVKTGLIFPYDAERLDNDNTLIADSSNSRVIEVDYNGTIVWEYSSGVEWPYDVERLNNGNTLIVDINETSSRVIEVDNNSTIVWQKTGLFAPNDAERLDNGNTLIVETGVGRVIEVDDNGTMVWNVTELNYPSDAERLDNGNTLIADTDNSRVIEVNNNGTIVWECEAEFPSDVERLNKPPYPPSNPIPPDGATDVSIVVNLSWTGGDPDGDPVTFDVYFGTTSPPLLVAENLNDTEYEPAGTLNYSTTYYWKIVAWDNYGTSTEGSIWSFTTTAENVPPGVPIINGPTSGKAGTSYTYNFVSTDSDEDNVSYYIEWGDGGTTDWTALQPSGDPGYSENHTWDTKGTYTIRAKAKDIWGAESDWETLDVTMPKNKAFNFNFYLLEWLFERFPHALPILRQLLGL